MTLDAFFNRAPADNALVKRFSSRSLQTLIKTKPILGLFSFFSREIKKADNGALIIGFLRTTTSKHLGLALGSNEYEAACTSAAERVETDLLPVLSADKPTQQEIVDLLSENCGDRFNEAFGAYLILLWVRFGKIQVAIAQGKVKPEEATIFILSQALLRQIKQLVCAPSK